MADDKRQSAGAAALAISVPTAILAAVALSRKVQTAPPGEELVIPKELLDLVIAIAASSEKIDDGIQELTQELAQLAINVQGFPPNSPTIQAVALTCVAVNIAYQGPYLEVPEGLQLVVKSHPLNPAASIIQVGSTAAECLNVNSSWPLIANESVGLQVKNANSIYVSSNLANCVVIFLAEKV